MNENSSKIKVKGGEGYGMFDKATRIEIYILMIMNILYPIQMKLNK